MEGVEKLYMNNANCKFTPIVGFSDFTKNINNLVSTVSENSASVLIIGEKGTGKRLIAQHIHYKYLSDQENQNNIKKDFYEINCRIFKSADVQMILDGIGRFIPEGKKVTLFINNVDFLSMDLQLHLLNTIKKSKDVGINLKVICSTEVNLEELIDSGKFSKDLFYYINAVVLNLLPLRFRKDDIIPIAEYYCDTFRKQSGINISGFSEESKKVLLEQYWPGNIDELINSIQRAFIVSNASIIKTTDLGLSSCNPNDVSAYVVAEDKTLKTAIDSFKKEYVTKILEENNWNQTKTAKILGIQRTYVIKLINDLNIRK